MLEILLAFKKLRYELRYQLFKIQTDQKAQLEKTEKLYFKRRQNNDLIEMTQEFNF